MMTQLVKRPLARSFGSNPSSYASLPPGYVFVIQNNKIVTLAGKPVIRKVA